MKLVLLALVALVAAEKVRYDGDAVFRVNLGNETVYSVLNGAVERLGLDMWTDIRPSMTFADVHVPADMMARFAALGLPMETMIANLQREIDREESEMLKGEVTKENFFTAYQPYDEISKFIANLATSHPQLVQLIEAGKTAQGATIYGVRIASSRGNKRGSIVSIGCQHAREWVTPAVVTFLANEFATQYESSEIVRELVDTFNWVFIPVVNIDGYRWSWTNTRMWRKTRGTNPGSTCLGTDPNRNWGYRWNNGGSSSNPCSDTYHGTGPMSTPEVSSIGNYVESLGDTVAFIDWHAYSQLWMYPWGWSCSVMAPDRSKMDGAARAAAGALRTVNNIVFGTGDSCNVIYLASGGADDWTYGALNVVYSFSVELRDTGRYGFLLPADQILPSGYETFAGVRGMTQYILSQLDKE